MHGPRLEAAIVPGGADWQYVRGDGVVEPEARYSIRTSEVLRLPSQIGASGTRRPS